MSESPAFELKRQRPVQLRLVDEEDEVERSLRSIYTILDEMDKKIEELVKAVNQL